MCVCVLGCRGGEGILMGQNFPGILFCFVLVNAVPERSENSESTAFPKPLRVTAKVPKMLKLFKCLP